MGTRAITAREHQHQLRWPAHRQEDTFFGLTGLNFDNTSLMTVDSLSGNTFNQTISYPTTTSSTWPATPASKPSTSIPSMPALSTAARWPNWIGASANQSYVFPGNFTVGSDATLSVAAGVPVTINPAVSTV